MRIERSDTKIRTGKAIPVHRDHLWELFQATERIGHTSEQAMRWFLRFAQCDLSTLHDEDWFSLEYELTAFRCLGIPDAKPMSEKSPLHWGGWCLELAGETGFGRAIDLS